MGTDTTSTDAAREARMRIAVRVGLTIAVLTYGLWLATQPNFISDIFWQIRLGDEIRMRHSVPSRDEFSWSCPNKPIVLHEWGTCLVFAEVYHHWGGWLGIFILLVLIAATLSLGLFALILKRIPNNPFLAFFLLLFAGRLCGQFITPRPHLFTFLGLVASMAVFFYTRRQAKVTILPMILLAVIEILWANMHAGAPIFICICGCYFIGDALQGRLIAKSDPELSRKMLRQSMAASVCAAVTLVCMVVNPSGIHIYDIITDTVGNKTMPNVVTEWRPADFHSEFGRVLEIFLFVLGISLAAGRKNLRYGDLFAVAFLSLAALYALRNIPIIGLAGSLIIAPYTVAATERIVARYTFTEALRRYIDSRRSLYSYAGAFALAGCMILGLVTSVKKNIDALPSHTMEAYVEHNFQMEILPTDACRFIEREQFPASMKMYNEYNTGGYLISALPDHKVFISTETYVYFGPVFDTYIKLESLPFDWRRLLAPYDPDFVLMGTDDRQSHLFLNAPDWALVYAGGEPSDDPNAPVSLVFIKRVPKYMPLILKCRKDCPMVGVLKSEGYLSAN